MRRRAGRHRAGAIVRAVRLRGQRGRESSRAEAAASRRQGQARHLPLHGRRAEPPGVVRHKPELAKWDGKLPPAELIKNYRAAFISPNSTLLGPKFKFARHGQSGAELSELLPKLAEVADDIAIVKSMHTDAFNHAPAQIFMNTGAVQFGRPSLGAWVTYGLGSESAGRGTS